MKLRDIAKSAIDILSGETSVRRFERQGKIEKRETVSQKYPMRPLNDIERAIYQQSHQWMDYDVYIQHKNWYATREQMMREQMYMWAKLQNGNMSLVDVMNDYKRHYKLLKLNKNTRVL